MSDDKKKQVIGQYGEMRLSMELHERGWQVHRAYIDEGIDFVATKYYCDKCGKYSNQYIKKTKYLNKNEELVDAKCVTNLCEHCKKNELTVISRYLQIKTSEGVATKDKNIRKFSFHPKIRYNMGEEVFYIWIAVFEDKSIKQCHFYIFNSDEVKKFDDITIDTYQITDNQKTSLTINNFGAVLNDGKKYDYSCFNDEFYENWDALEIEIPKK